MHNSTSFFYLLRFEAGFTNKHIQEMKSTSIFQTWYGVERERERDNTACPPERERERQWPERSERSESDECNEGNCSRSPILFFEVFFAIKPDGWLQPLNGPNGKPIEPLVNPVLILERFYKHLQSISFSLQNEWWMWHIEKIFFNLFIRFLFIGKNDG